MCTAGCRSADASSSKCWTSVLLHLASHIWWPATSALPAAYITGPSFTASSVRGHSVQKASEKTGTGRSLELARGGGHTGVGGSAGNHPGRRCHHRWGGRPWPQMRVPARRRATTNALQRVGEGGAMVRTAPLPQQSGFTAATALKAESPGVATIRIARLVGRAPKYKAYCALLKGER